MSEWLGITGSAAYDVAACPSRAALPQAREPAGEAAERGTALHTFAEKVSLDPDNREKYLEEVPEEWRHTAKGMNLDAALDGIEVLGLEVAFVLNVKEKTCRKIGSGIGREYAKHTVLTRYDIPFTVDVLGRSIALDCPVELDYKSGQSIGPVEENGQRKVSATGLLLHYGADAAISRVAYIRESGVIDPDGHEFSILDAWQVCDELTEAIDKVVAAKEQVAKRQLPTVYPDRDRQCRYCPSFSSCPYWANLLKSALENVNNANDNLEHMTLEQAGAAFNYLKDVEKVLAKALDAGKAWAGKGPLPIDDKYEFREIPRDGKDYFDQAGARGKLVTLMGRLEMTDEEIAEEMAALQKTGKNYVEVRKCKRTA